MKKYSMSVELEGSMTTFPLLARNNFHARVLAVQKISASNVSDRRLARGKVTVKDPEEKIVYTINEESLLDVTKGDPPEPKKGDK